MTIPGLTPTRWEEVETPAMVADGALINRNLDRMAAYFRSRAAKLRPHFKSHKCVELARRQMAAGGACGITCAKLAEAEHLVTGGLKDVLIANQVVGAGKARRLARLNRSAMVRSAVDSVENVRELSEAACAEGVTIGVLVEVDVGMGRCGVPPGAPAVELAHRVAQSAGLRFDGLQGYEGHLVAKFDHVERKRKVTEALAPLIATRAQIAASGLPVPIVSGGGTGTYDITGGIPGIDEVQCGSYALMDAAYRRVRPEFVVARWVLTRIISVGPAHVVSDVGFKGLGSEFGLPEVEGRPEAKVRHCSEEHTIIENLPARVGDVIRLIPSHGCTTNNLYRRMWIFENDRITGAWDIEASGALE